MIVGEIFLIIMKVGKRSVIFFVLLLCALNSTDVVASGFISFGSGYSFQETRKDAVDDKGSGVPFILEYQYSPGYRDSLIFNSSISYFFNTSYDINDMLVYSAGAMYVKPFLFYSSNITGSTLKQNSCLGILLLPFTVTRDTLNNVFQLLIPDSPFAFFNIVFMQEKLKSLKPGFSTGFGVTSGMIDLRLRYIQILNHRDRFERDHYFINIEFTYNIPLQDQFIRTEPLIN